jgi:hypothetical protein
MKRPALLLLLGLVAAPAAAQESPTCDAPEHRQFDFWVGDWEVDAANGEPAGRNTIRSILGGCALREEWRGARGYDGTSLNFYDRASGRWHQTWIGSDGEPLYIEGELDAEGRMVMASTERGGRVDRITWTPNSDGTVRQLWERSADAGATWSVLFNGTYRKAAAAE